MIIRVRGDYDLKYGYWKFEEDATVYPGGEYHIGGSLVDRAAYTKEHLMKFSRYEVIFTDPDLKLDEGL